MGNSSTKIEPKKNTQEKQIRVIKLDKSIETDNSPLKFDEKTFGKEDIKKIIKQYEYVKTLKHITNIDTIVGVMKNTDWCKVEYNEHVMPSAPLMLMPYKPQAHIPIPVAQIIVAEPVVTISSESVQVAKII
jgi:hypothetical protein